MIKNTVKYLEEENHDEEARPMFNRDGNAVQGKW
jgi:hypothetical protein